MTRSESARSAYAQAADAPVTSSEVAATLCQGYRLPVPGYQHAAAVRFFTTTGRTVQPWHWITTNCSIPLCMNVQHMNIYAPRRLSYPARVCIYCGRSGWTRDHLLPTPMTGRAARRYVLTVPACQQCNSFISDAPTANIDIRRDIAHRAIRRKYAKQMQTVLFTKAELAELGPTLRTHCIGAMALKQEVIDRLNWPDDTAYDLRALTDSGIENPYATGLLGREN